MNKEDCEKLLDVFAATALATRSIDTDAAKEACESLDSLREVIVNIMADEKKPVYRDGGITVKEVPLPYTVSPTVTDYKPIVTCNGSTLAE